VGRDKDVGETTSKANDYAVDTLKQVLTLASAILALTITFLKDTLGSERGHAAWTWLVPAGWVFLIVVVWTAWVAMADASKRWGLAKRRATFSPGEDRAN
jgi:hypothetical protein